MRPPLLTDSDTSIVYYRQFLDSYAEFSGRAWKTVEGYSRISIHVVDLVAVCNDAEVQARPFARE
jgi:hypothetical protein